MKPFTCVCADPPWKFGDKLPGKTRGAERNYPTIGVDDLCNLILPHIADDAWLFMWRVSSQVPEAYRVVKAWGFEPKTELVWRKLTSAGKESFGMGRSLRGAHETCIVAKRGRPKILNHSTRTIFSAVTGKHSEKPPEFFRIVEDLCPGPRLELFGRAARVGWTVIGDEAPGQVTLRGKAK
jgi:N6-adenosine-specific RNA methylase IME4